MNDNKNVKKLSGRLEEVFEQMDDINSTCQEIEIFIQAKYAELENLINPEKDADIAKEIRFYMAHFLKKQVKAFEKSNHSLH